MKIQPLFDRVLIEPEEQERVTKSGIMLPPTNQERPQTGTVKAIGSGLDFENRDVGMLVKVNDKVLFNKYSGNEIKLNDKTYIILRQVDIIAKIEE